MTKSAFSAILAVLSCAAFAAPLISNVEVSQDVANRSRTYIRYKLAGEAAVITANVETNVPGTDVWLPLADMDITGMTGDVYRVIQPDRGRRKITWSERLDGSLPPDLTAKTIRVSLTAWHTNSPPDYLVVDISPYGDSVQYPCYYYPSEALLPVGGSVTNACYKDSYIVFKRMHCSGKVWMMGTDEVEQTAIGGSARSDEKPHPVMLTEDYYIAVYELTRAQNARVANNNGTWTDSRLPQNGSPNNRRGTTDGGSWPSFDANGNFDFATSHSVGASSWLGKFRSRSGLVWADYPTEAQWEFAARGGCDRALYSGEAPTDANLKRIARCTGNKTETDCEGLSNTGDGTTATVGSYEPNAYGLYDMIGNRVEPVLDRYDDWSSLDASVVQVDPYGNSDSGSSNYNKFVFRGGDYWSYGYIANGGTTGGRYKKDLSSASSGACRLVITLHNEE